MFKKIWGARVHNNWSCQLSPFPEPPPQVWGALLTPPFPELKNRLPLQHPIQTAPATEAPKGRAGVTVQASASEYRPVHTTASPSQPGQAIAQRHTPAGTARHEPYLRQTDGRRMRGQLCAGGCRMRLLFLWRPCTAGLSGMRLEGLRGMRPPLTAPHSATVSKCPSPCQGGGWSPTSDPAALPETSTYGSGRAVCTLPDATQPSPRPSQAQPNTSPRPTQDRQPKTNPRPPAQGQQPDTSPSPPCDSKLKNPFFHIFLVRVDRLILHFCPRVQE